MDGRTTDGRRTTEPSNPISSPGAFGSGELKNSSTKFAPSTGISSPSVILLLLNIAKHCITIRLISFSSSLACFVSGSCFRTTPAVLVRGSRHFHTDSLPMNRNPCNGTNNSSLSSRANPSRQSCTSA